MKARIEIAGLPLIELSLIEIATTKDGDTHSGEVVLEDKDGYRIHVSTIVQRKVMSDAE